MTTSFVPVPLPVGNPSSGTPANKSRRSSSLQSLDSVSTSSNSSKSQGSSLHSGGFRKTVTSEHLDSTNMINNNSPSLRTRLNGTNPTIEYSSRPEESDSANWEERPATPTMLGYEVMEERAKFTVYKILVKNHLEENWVVFRRYTDFSRLNDKLKEMFPGFRLALPPKRWFKDNYDPNFLEERQLGLQAFLQNLVAHKDIANSTSVREFLCLDDPPGPFDSLEESRAFCETLEETNYRLQKELADKQKEVEALKRLLEEKHLHIEFLESRVRELSLEQENTRRPSGQESECSGEVESSAVEADQAVIEDNSLGMESDIEQTAACQNSPITEASSVEEAQAAEEDK
ncbi:sorting nexin-16 isoform X1 [Pristis pectinata]|uniref:sorting nexin-16 isoform X1 n=1 Tax=Pristis pectinata TaxID=685728 RepID=UPI00223D1C41|nr:sorting nexin-16 isoform X1 [Pristis pectinata]XP_051879737.1 sorting nexin-16 isoform X1 [Pristis pectinata]XP_051879738.1 sorting nexin-16 isoform X1 [Pristis pectinata]XP_051879739.1 sorting nexin-16 isoform X1 [Pristis pectinata]XP_051879740.1 sorting nexin-16 isoform X1 [Pristis pectinata]XP_051879741.1 sorting nexin-16 isoform X1 [Pristis pectinata]